MALMDYVSEAVNRFTPQKREKLPAPVTTASGGIGHFAMHEEDVRAYSYHYHYDLCVNLMPLARVLSVHS